MTQSAMVAGSLSIAIEPREQAARISMLCCGPGVAPGSDGPGRSSRRRAPGDWDEEPARCVSLTRIDRTETVDDRTIVFYMNGDDIYVNRLDRSCPGRDDDKAFSYRTSRGQLCRLDVITVLEDFGFGLSRGDRRRAAIAPYGTSS